MRVCVRACVLLICALPCAYNVASRYDSGGCKIQHITNVFRLTIDLIAKKCAVGRQVIPMVITLLQWSSSLSSVCFYQPATLLSCCLLVLSLCAEGDTLRTWRIDPYLMVERGQAWLPPPMLAADIAAGVSTRLVSISGSAVHLHVCEREREVT